MKLRRNFRKNFESNWARIEKRITFAAHSQGFVAEWLGTALQKLLQRFESARNLQKNSKAAAT